jgi:serine/threonine protein kinase
MTLARIGRFEIERALGGGTFSTVWLGLDVDLDAPVAIKILAENWSLNDDARRRFMEEARALRLLDNDRIVRVYEVGRLGDGRPYMVMEYADRGSLEDRMRQRFHFRQPFSVEEAVGLSVEIAECLIAAHDLRIVHRDLKPSNVLFRKLAPARQEALRREGSPVTTERVLLADFGIARRLEGVLNPTKVVGSPHYMAPEQGDPGRAAGVDYRGDIYSAAVVLYELLAGQVPFDYSSLAAVSREGTRAVRSIRDIRHEVPASLEAAIAQGLAQDPRDRYPSARAWRDALHEAARDRWWTVDRRPGSETAGDRIVLPDVATARASIEGATVPRTAASRTVQDPTRAATASLRSDGETDILPSGTMPVRPDPVRIREAPAPEDLLPTVEEPPPPAGSGRRGRPPLPDPGELAKGLHLRVPAVLMATAYLALVASILLPWAEVVTGRTGTTARLGVRFGGAKVALACAVALGIVTIRIWRTRRRWIAAGFSFVGFVGGVAALALTGYEALEVRGQALAGDPAGAASIGVGLAVLLGGAVVGSLGGYLALKRARRPQPLGPESNAG